MESSASDAGMTLDCRKIKVTIGLLAIGAAAAAGTGPAMTAPLFGALVALTLSAGAGLAALLELMASDRDRVWRAAAWGSLVPAWIVFAAMLLHAPLLHLDALRVLASVLLIGGALLRAWRCHGEPGFASPGITLALVFALLALATAWSGVWLQVGDTAVAALNIACALELFGAGSVWLVEGFFNAAWRPAAGYPSPRQSREATQMA